MVHQPQDAGSQRTRYNIPLLDFLLVIWFSFFLLPVGVDAFGKSLVTHGSSRNYEGRVLIRFCINLLHQFKKIHSVVELPLLIAKFRVYFLELIREHFIFIKKMFVKFYPCRFVLAKFSLLIRVQHHVGVLVGVFTGHQSCRNIDVDVIELARVDIQKCFIEKVPGLDQLVLIVVIRLRQKADFLLNGLPLAFFPILFIHVNFNLVIL